MTAPLPAPTASRAATPPASGSRVDGPLLGFFIAAFALPWAVWWSQVAQQRGWTTWHLPGGIALWTLVPVTLTAVAATGGRAGLAELGRRLIRWRAPGRMWAAAIGLPLTVAAVAAAAGAAVTGSAHLGETLSLPASLTYLGYGIGLFLLTEEAAWRGFALPRLMSRLSPLAAALVLGVIWAGWHAPTFQLASQSDSTIPYWGFAIMVVATSVMTAWLYLGSGGSVLLCAVWHAVADASFSWTGVIGRDHHAFWVAVILQVAVATVLALRHGRRLQRPGPLAVVSGHAVAWR